MLSHLIEEYSPIMEAGVSLRCSQESSTGQCPELNPVHAHITLLVSSFFILFPNRHTQATQKSLFLRLCVYSSSLQCMPQALPNS